MKSRLEIGLIEGENLMKRGGIALVNNIGKTIAAITLIVAALVTFTEITFADFGTEAFATSALMLILASYLMYFSMEDAGERLGEESEEYRSAMEVYAAELKKVKGEDIESLREFCLAYSEQELAYRQKAFVTSNALSVEAFNRFLAGEKTDEKSEKIFRKAKRMKAIPLSPKTLLSKERENGKSELKNPERSKLFHLIAKLIPTTLCMTVTVSVMLTAKEGLSPAAVIEGILKLSTLPIVGFKGYAGGYSYVRKTYAPWLETKGRLLETYNEKKTRTT